MTITEFKEKKYWNKLVDLKKVTREFNQNEKDRKKLFALKNKWKSDSFEFMMIKWRIIW